jgi:exodeoxyribonuclease V alpha subunit
VELHRRLHDGPLKVALAAPTGKAAGRMSEALRNEFARLGLDEPGRDSIPEEAVTIHRLLRGTEEKGLLPPPPQILPAFDLVVIDEASMIDLNLMSRLVNRLHPHSRLILLGDRDQLASVEAGSVFADLCRKSGNTFSAELTAYLKELRVEPGPDEIPGDEQDGTLSGLNDSVLYLTESYRFGKESGIGRLAGLVKEGGASAERIASIYNDYADLELHDFGYDPSSLSGLSEAVTGRVRRFSDMIDPVQILDEWKKEVWLTVHRKGSDGSEQLNRYAEQMVRAAGIPAGESGWFHGRVIMITKNDYGLSVFNGDIGVCLKETTAGGDARYMVYIESAGGLKVLPASRITSYTPAWFMTVHKSQGSEFGRVNLLLPEGESAVLTRELIYTAITRTRDSFHLYGSIEKLALGITRPTVRYSGLGIRT